MPKITICINKRYNKMIRRFLVPRSIIFNAYTSIAKYTTCEIEYKKKYIQEPKIIDHKVINEKAIQLMDKLKEMYEDPLATEDCRLAMKRWEYYRNKVDYITDTLFKEGKYGDREKEEAKKIFEQVGVSDLHELEQKCYHYFHVICTSMTHQDKIKKMETELEEWLKVDKDMYFYTTHQDSNEIVKLTQQKMDIERKIIDLHTQHVIIMLVKQPWRIV